MKILYEIEFRGRILSKDEIKQNKELVVHLYQNKLIELTDKELEEYGLKPSKVIKEVEETKEFEEKTENEVKEETKSTKRVRRTRKK